MASTYLTRTPSSAGNRQKWTWSAWIKLSNFAGSAGSMLLSAYAHGNDEFRIYFGDTYKLSMRFYNGSEYQLETNRLFRDLNAWYHLVFAVDTTLNTSGDRFKIYVNGVRETSFSAESQPTQNLQMTINDTTPIQIGRHGTGTNYFDGYMSHVHLCDGYAYDASAFGSTDATTGEWKINTSPSVTYGTNGFFILKDGNSVTDQSSNTNNFTVAGGTLTKSEDNPSNVFATMGTPTWYDGTITNGGNTVSTDQTNYRYQSATLGVNKGKWYWEVKISSVSNYMLCGITDEASPPNTASGYVLGSGANAYAVYYGDGSTGGGNGHLMNNNGVSPTNTPGQFMAGFSAGNIITFALDCDNNTLKVGVNGQWANGSNATNQTFANTTAKAINSISSTSGFYFPACGDYGGGTSVLQYNFGNGYFGTTAVSSAGTNASGIGIFEYDVPTGYTALSTKGLNL